MVLSLVNSGSDFVVIHDSVDIHNLELLVKHDKTQKSKNMLVVRKRVH